MKKVIIFFTTLVILLGIFATPVQAVETMNRGFKINSADYDIELKENGDANVIEHWHLEYTDNGNTFSARFIPTYTKNLAKRTTLDNLKIYINENICT